MNKNELLMKIDLTILELKKERNRNVVRIDLLLDKSKEISEKIGYLREEATKINDAIDELLAEKTEIQLKGWFDEGIDC